MRSKTALVHVSRTMDSASRMGTPELTRVPSVRMVRATIVFSIRPPMIGIQRYMRSRAYDPVLLSRMSLISNQKQSGNNGRLYQYWANQRDVDMSMSVNVGSCILKSLKIFSNLGMMNTMM